MVGCTVGTVAAVVRIAMATCLCHALFFSDGPMPAETTQGKQIPRCSRQKCKYFARGKINFHGEQQPEPYTPPSREEVVQFLQARGWLSVPVTQPLHNDYRPMSHISNPVTAVALAQPCSSMCAAPVMMASHSMPPRQQPLLDDFSQLMPPPETTTVMDKLEGVQAVVGQALKAAQALTKNVLALQNVFTAIVTQVEELSAQVEAERAEREESEREQADREKAAREKAAREQAAREMAERIWEAREKAEREREAREKAEREAREKAEREKAEREEAQRKEAERKEAERKEAEREREAREKAVREKAVREKAEREEAERKEAERKEAEREKEEREREARAKAEREEAEREEAERKEEERKEAERKEAERNKERKQKQQQKALQGLGNPAEDPTAKRPRKATSGNALSMDQLGGSNSTNRSTRAEAKQKPPHNRREHV